MGLKSGFRVGMLQYLAPPPRIIRLRLFFFFFFDFWVGCFLLEPGQVPKRIQIRFLGLGFRGLGFRVSDMVLT